MWQTALDALRYKNWSIRLKLLSITIVLIISSVVAVSLLSYQRYTIDFQAQSAVRIQQTIEQLSYNIESYLDDLNRLSLAPLYNTDLMNALEQPAPDTDLAKLEKRRLIETYLDNMMVIPRKDILSVYILSDEIYRGGRYSASVDNTVRYQDFDWYKQALATENVIFVPAHMEQFVSTPRFKIFSLVKSIRSLKVNSDIIGVIKVDANYTGIELLCNKVNMGKDGGLFIMDQNRNVIFSSLKDRPLEDLYQQIINSKKPYTITKIDDKNYLLNAITIQSANWTVVALNSIDELNQGAIQTRKITYLLAIACSLLAILVMLVFTNSFLNPLFQIIQLMKEVKRGNFQVEFPEQRRDEIGYLGSSFNTMIQRINYMMQENTRLVTEVYEARILQKEAQINALYSQIRPHFLYNTLNMISLLIQCNRADDAVDNINKLSSLLRGMIHVPKEIPVETEINLLVSYLGIQASRFSGRLEYQIDIDPRVSKYKIPSLIFQPVVENSIIHGCEKRKEKTLVQIYSTLEDDSLIFHIEDNAGGIDPDRLARLRQRLAGQGTETRLLSASVAPLPDALGAAAADEKTTQQAANDGEGGIGLVNVNRRIKIEFGERYGLEIDSEPGRGTHVRIILPKPADG